MEFTKSICLFFYGILRRFWVWAPAFILDPYDLWARVIKPMLPKENQFDLPWSTDWAPIVLVVLIIWAAILTFHEVRTLYSKKAFPDLDARIAFKYIVLDSRWAKNRVVGADADLLYAAERELRDHASIGSLHMWGRPNSLSSIDGDSSLQEIPKDYWGDGHFDMISLSGMGEGEAIAYKSTVDYTDKIENIRLSKSEVMRIWPKSSPIERFFDKERNKRKNEFANV